MNVCDIVYSNYLAHHGIKGQKWGVRRFQNPDGSLTAEGVARYREKGESSYIEIHEGAVREGQRHGDDTQSFERAEKNVSNKFKKQFAKVHDDVLNRHRKELDESGNRVKESAKKYGFGIVNRRKNAAALSEARAASIRANQDFFNDMYTTSLDFINTLPKNERDKAKAYVYNLLDW